MRFHATFWRTGSVNWRGKKSCSDPIDRGGRRPLLLPGCAVVVGPLFEEPDAFPRDLLADRLRQLAAQNILIGGSSWKYEGWLGQIYRRERYLSRGRFSKKLFEV